MAHLIKHIVKLLPIKDAAKDIKDIKAGIVDEATEARDMADTISQTRARDRPILKPRDKGDTNQGRSRA